MCGVENATLSDDQLCVVTTSGGFYHGQLSEYMKGRHYLPGRSDQGQELVLYKTNKLLCSLL
jgi:hypothetical protein